MDKRHREYYIAALIIAVHAAVTVFLSARLNIWLDEVYTLHTSSGDIISAYKNAILFEGQPPLYFVLITAWRKIIETAFFARLFSVITIAFTLLIIYKTARKYFANVNALIVLLLFAVNPLMIWAGSEMRCYAMVLLLGSLNIFYFVKVYINDPNDKKGRVIFVIISVLGVFTQYFFAFLLVGNFVFLLCYRKWNTVLKYLTDMIAPVVLIFIVIYPYLTQQIDEHTQSLAENTISLKGSFSFVMARMESYLVPFDIVPYRRIIRWLLRIFLLSAAGYMVLKINKVKFKIPPENSLYFYFLVTTITIAVIFAAIRYKLLPESLLMPRHTLILTLPFIYLFISSLVLIPNRAIQYVILVLLIGFSTFKVYNSDKDLVKVRDYPSLVSFIESNEKPQQPVLIFPNYVALPFDYYYNGINKIHALPKSIDLSSNFTNEDYTIKSNDEFLNIVSKLTSGVNGFWYITTANTSDAKLLLDMKKLENLMSEKYEVKIKKEFKYNFYLYYYVINAK
jgi:uncharacterized membrane protein